MSIAGKLQAIHDSGPPEGSTDYTTLVLLHGYVWHSGIFSKLLPIAKDYNTRVVAVNRRDYPGSAPYTEEERAALTSLAPDASEEAVAEANEKLTLFIRDRAREIFDFLEDLVKRNDIPRAQPGKNAGGIVVAGWSFGTVFAHALLSYAPSFPVNEIDLSKYVRRVVSYDPAYHIMGYPQAPGAYNPVIDRLLNEEERRVAFNIWATGYYDHGDTLDTLEMRTPLTDPPPTVYMLSSSDLADAVHPPPGDVGGPDNVLLISGEQTGLFGDLRRGAMYISGGRNQAEGDLEVLNDGWRDIELRFICCEQSVWEVTYAMWLFRSELDEARKRNVAVRSVRFVRVKKGNHFVHWDRPAWALRALVGDEDEIM